MLDAIRNPTPEQIHALAAKSNQRALCRTVTPVGDACYWPFERATYAEGARVLKLPYDKPPGAGDVVFVD